MTPSWASSGLPLFIFLFFVVFHRAQLTYWLGRGAAKGALASAGKNGLRGKIAAWFEGPVPKYGARLLEQWGIVIIPLCFLTVGVQTAVNAGAGVVRMSWKKYTLAMIPGCIAWSIMYGLLRLSRRSFWSSDAAGAEANRASSTGEHLHEHLPPPPPSKRHTKSLNNTRRPRLRPYLPPNDTRSRKKTQGIACEIHRLHVELARSVRETHAEQREARMGQQKPDG